MHDNRRTSLAKPSKHTSQQSPILPYSTAKSLGSQSVYKQSSAIRSGNNLAADTQPPPVEKKRSVMFLYNFWLGPGNNSQLVKRVLQTRDNWQEVAESEKCHFRWAQTNRSYKYALLSSNMAREAVNHFQFHWQISDKANLIRNLNEYCDNVAKINMYTVTPPTFIIDFSDIFCDKAINDFLLYYCRYYPKPDTNRMKMEYLKYFKSMITGAGHKHRHLTNKYCQYNMLDTYLDEKNNGYMWLLKPTSLNRGRGVRVFSELNTLKEYFNQYTLGYFEKPLKETSRTTTNTGSNKQIMTGSGSIGVSSAATNSSTTASTVNSATSQALIKTDAFIIQKYIEKPLLVNNRKFDIRTWVLVDHQLNVYFFREGYIRMSSEQYDLSAKNIQNSFIHLTNNAVQKYSENYCKFQSGNQLSFPQLEKYLLSSYKETIDRQVSQGLYNSSADFFNMIRARMKEIAKLSMLSVKKKLNPYNRKHCMEIFGYDFILDEQMRVWLIQVNTNPCIEESSPLLAQLIPRMLNDAFKLTIDVIFPKWNQISESQSNKVKIIEVKVPQRVVDKKSATFRVDGYDDEMNMWEKIVDSPNKV